MAEDWAAIAAEVAAAIGEVGFGATLLRPSELAPQTPWDGFPPQLPTEYPIVVIDDRQRVRDASGTLIGQTMRTLTVSATGVVPQQGDTVLVGGSEHEIAEIRPLAPGGVALLYELDLAR